MGKKKNIETFGEHSVKYYFISSGKNNSEFFGIFSERSDFVKLLSHEDRIVRNTSIYQKIMFT
jgi:hypothetical protein